MSVIDDSEVVVIKLKGSVDSVRVKTYQEFIAILPDILTGFIKNGNTGVIVSSQQPGIKDRNKLWIKTLTNGNVVAPYVFSSGKWRPLFPARQYVWVDGDSRTLKPGQILVDTGRGDIDPAVISRVVSQYQKSTDGTYYIYFAVTLPGF